jgi:hypothetical protein
VRPQVLRFALVRDVFYRNVTFPVDLVISHVADRSQVVLTLIGAQLRGANIPIQQLQPLVINSPTDKVLDAFAWLGCEEAEWVLHQYPNKLATICDAGLSLAPETFLSAMLSAAVGDNRQLSSYPDHPLRRIGDWVASARPGTADILKRRALLLAALEHWLNEIGGWNIGGQALGSVLSPRFEYENVDPGEGNQVRFTFGVVSLDQLHEIETLWPRVKNILATNDIPDWSPVCGIIENWAYPERHGVTLPKENYVAIQLFAKEMLQDIIPLIGENLGTLRWARGLVLNLGWDIVVPTNGEFETLYPFWIHKEELPLFESRMKDIIIELAETWSRANPIDIAHRLSLFDSSSLY